MRAVLFWRRVAAYLLDILILFAVLGPAGFLVQRWFGVLPRTGPEIWLALVVNFSLPVWVYFTVADAARGGATVGKFATGVRVVRTTGARVDWWRALLRTAVKLLPWELAHLAAFGLAGAGSELQPVQAGGLVVANLLALAYLGLAARTEGRRTVADFVAGTEVRPTLKEALP